MHDNNEDDFFEFGDDPPPPKAEPGPLERIPTSTSIIPALATLVVALSVSIVYWRNADIAPWLAVSGENIFERKQYWRLFSALFVHSDVGHLLSNAPLLFVFGWFLRDFFGTIAFPVTSIILGALANLITVYFYPPQTNLVGASGMVYAMAALWLALYLRYEIRFNIPMRLFRVVGFTLVVMAPTTFSPKTSYLAHAAGFGLGVLAGLVGGRILTPLFGERSEKTIY